MQCRHCNIICDPIRRYYCLFMDRAKPCFIDRSKPNGNANDHQHLFIKCKCARLHSGCCIYYNGYSNPSSYRYSKQ